MLDKQRYTERNRQTKAERQREREREREIDRRQFANCANSFQEDKQKCFRWAAGGVAVRQ